MPQTRRASVVSAVKIRAESLPAGIIVRTIPGVYAILRGYVKSGLAASLLDMEENSTEVHHNGFTIPRIAGIPRDVLAAYSQMAPRLHELDVIIEPGTALLSIEEKLNSIGMLIEPYGTNRELTVARYGAKFPIPWDIAGTLVIPGNPAPGGAGKWLKSCRQKYKFPTDLP